MGARLVTMKNGAAYIVCTYSMRSYGSTVGPKLAAKLRQAATDYANAQTRQERQKTGNACAKLVEGFEFQDCHRAVASHVGLMAAASDIELPLLVCSAGSKIALGARPAVEEEVPELCPW